MLSLAWPGDLPAPLATREPDFELPTLPVGLTPAPGVVVPLVPEATRNTYVHCHPATSHQVFDGGEWETLGDDRGPVRALVADQARTIRELQAVAAAMDAEAQPPPPPPPGTPVATEERLRNSAIDVLGVVSFGGAPAPLERACGLPIRWASDATVGTVADVKTLAAVAAAAKGTTLVILSVPPKSPWADLAAVLTAVPAEHQWRLRLRVDPNAPAPPATDRLSPARVKEQLPNTAVTVQRDGVVVARFDTPQRLVHAQGQVLATLANDQVIAGIASHSYPNSGVQIYDALALTLPGWTSPLDYVYAIGPNGEVKDTGGVVVGTVVGKPSTLQRHMISLGFGMAFLPNVHLREAYSSPQGKKQSPYKQAVSVRASVDGTFWGFDDGARWSADAISFGGKTHPLDALSTVDGDGVLACSSTPGGPVRAAISGEGEMVLLLEPIPTSPTDGVLGASLPPRPPIFEVEIGDVTVGDVRHANVRAFCIAVAVLLERAAK